MLKKNSICLFFLYFVKLITPLLVLPILSSVLDDIEFSLYLNFMAITAWLIIIVEYGFVYSGTKEIAKANDDVSLRSIIHSILNAQILLSIFALVIAVILTFVLKSISGEYLPAMIAVVSVIIIGITPTYFYHGMQRFRFITIVESLSSLLFIILVLLFRQLKVLDVNTALLSYTLSKSLVLCVCYGGMVEYLLCFKFDLKSAVYRINNSLSLFIFKASSSLYGSAAAVLLGIMLSAKEVAIYVAADRLVRSYQGLLGPISQAVYPIISKDNNNNKMFLNVLLVQLLIGVIGVIGFAIFSDVVIRVIYGDNFNDSVNVAKFLIIIVPIIAISNMLGVNNLLAKGYDSLFSKVIVICGLLSCLLMYPMIINYGVDGMVYTVICTELMVLLLLLLFSIRYKNV